jgi:hypothetical protein
VLISLGAMAGPENPPGVVVLLEPGIGIREGPTLTWHLRPAWGLVAAMEVRTGPTWWTCGRLGCTGASTELGMQDPFHDTPQ